MDQMKFLIVGGERLNRQYHHLLVGVKTSRLGCYLNSRLLHKVRRRQLESSSSSPDCISVACFCCSHVAKNKYCRSVMISFKRLRHRRRPRTKILVWYSPLVTLSCNYTLLMRIYLPVALLSTTLVIFVDRCCWLEQRTSSHRFLHLCNLITTTVDGVGQYLPPRQKQNTAEWSGKSGITRDCRALKVELSVYTISVKHSRLTVRWWV